MGSNLYNTCLRQRHIAMTKFGRHWNVSCCVARNVIFRHCLVMNYEIICYSGKTCVCVWNCHSVSHVSSGKKGIVRLGYGILIICLRLNSYTTLFCPLNMVGYHKEKTPMMHSVVKAPLSAVGCDKITSGQHFNISVNSWVWTGKDDKQKLASFRLNTSTEHSFVKPSPMQTLWSDLYIDPLLSLSIEIDYSAKFGISYTLCEQEGNR